MTARTQISLDVLLEGHDEPVRVVADQRDLARREAMDLPDGRFTDVRYLGWSAAHRSGVYTGTWDDFNQRDCVEVVHGGDDEEEEDVRGDGLDPGRTDQSAAG